MTSITWLGSASNDWNTAANWSTGTVPAAGDDVTISAGTPTTPTLSGGIADAASITIADGTSLAFRSVASVAITGNFVDNGSFGIDTGFLTDSGGSTLSIGGTLTVTNAGGGFAIGNRAQSLATTVSAGGLTNIGTINIAGNENGTALASLVIASSAGMVGSGGVLTGNINLGIGVGGAGGFGDALLDFQGGGLINTIQSGTVQLTGPKAFIATGATTSANSALTGPLTIAAGGGLVLQGGVSVTPSALTIAGTLDVDGGFLGVGGSTVTVGGAATITSTGSLSIGRSAMSNSGPTVTIDGSLSNAGSIVVTGDVPDLFQGVLNVSATAGFGTGGVLSGNVSLTGLSLLDFGAGQISTIDTTGNLVIDGPNAFLASGKGTSGNTALTGLTAVNGFFSLLDGAQLATSGGVAVGNGTNFAALNVDNTGTGGSVLQIGGTLTLDNGGGVTAGGGFISATATLAVNALNLAGVANTGVQLVGGVSGGQVTGQADLTVSSLAGFGQVGVLSGGNVTLIGSTLLDFTAGGQISSTVFGADLTIDGPQAFIAAGGATNGNTALAGLSLLGGDLVLHSGAVVAP